MQHCKLGGQVLCIQSAPDNYQISHGMLHMCLPYLGPEIHKRKTF